MTRRESGFTLIEAIVVMLLLAVAAAVALPRALQPSPSRQVEVAARTLTRDLEQVRMRAIAAKRHVRVRFYATDRFYSAFMDVSPDRSGVFSESSEEARASGVQVDANQDGVPGVRLPAGVRFGAGSVTIGPDGSPVTADIDLEDDMVEFSGRGLVLPPSKGGTVYLTHKDDPDAVAAVTVSGASAFQAWRYIASKWVR